MQDKQVTAAAVDSTAFFNYKNVLHKDSKDICVLDSIGPLPPYAIICNKSLDGTLHIRHSTTHTHTLNNHCIVFGAHEYWYCNVYFFLDGLKSKIVQALLNNTTERTWANRFKKFGLIKFVENSNDSYTELEFSESLGGSGLSSIYYWNITYNNDVLFVPRCRACEPQISHFLTGLHFFNRKIILMCHLQSATT